MNYLSLQIDNQWAYLKEGTEIALEGNNPIFSDSGSKTYLFQLHVESNRHLFGNADEIYGESYYKAIDGKRATLYVSGIPVMTGKVSLEDEVYMDEDGCIAINLVSGNLEFAQMIEGMNCRDVEQADEVVVGYKYKSINATWTMYDDVEVVNGDIGRQLHQTYELPDEFNVVRSSSLLGDNILDPYPIKKYCTIRAAYMTDKSLTSEVHNFINNGDYTWAKELRDQISNYTGDVFILGSARRNTGICFYANYFIDCLEKTLGIRIVENMLLGIEDFNRLAFVNMRCRTNGKSGTAESVSIKEAMKDIGGIDLFSSEAYSLSASALRYNAVATSENFPDQAVADVISALSNAFCVRFIHNSTNNQMRILLMKDVLSDNEVNNIPCTVLSAHKIDDLGPVGFRIRYDGGESDTSYNFAKYDSCMRINRYGSVISLENPFDSNVYVDERNGNAYAIKVDEEGDSSGDEKSLHPSIFEVGGYSPVEYGDCSNEELVEEHSINFLPIINIDVNAKSNIERVKISSSDTNLKMNYALLVDKEIEHGYKSIKDVKSIKIRRNKQKYSVDAGTGITYYDFLGSNGDISNNILWKPSSEETAVNSYDVGFMLGIMRGPGNAAGVEYFDENFDGEGNSRVTFTSANYAFTSDSIDNCNNDFDYNGTGEGGVDYSGRFSLKLRAGKYDKEGNPVKDADGNPIVIQNKERAERGLYDKFWKEYAYFTVNKKIVRLRLRMEVADFITLDWTKRYKIGEYVGFIANWNMSVSDKGISEVEMDMYYI